MPWTPDIFDDCKKYFMLRYGFEPNGVQRDFFGLVSGNDSKGLYILEAPMGVGKTEAALSAAEYLCARFHLGGLYFGLPTQATANGIFSRMVSWAKRCDDKKHSIRLAHRMKDLNDEYRSIFHGTAPDSGDDTLLAHDWFEGRKQAMLSDFVAATVDQLLLASLKQKHFMLRRLGLAGKTVIIDECHCYDSYMNYYLDNTLRFLGFYGVPVIIMSATLTSKRRYELVCAYCNSNKINVEERGEPCSYPAVTYTLGEPCEKRAAHTAISYDGKQRKTSILRACDKALISLLCDKLEDGGCAAVIVNTVSRAQSKALEIASAMPDFKVICFHSGFISAERIKIENSIVSLVGKNSDSEQRNRVIVVGTQVIEQSLDIDFDFMITDLCPMDLLLQRMGRLHRHDRVRPEKLSKPELAVIFNEKDPIYSNVLLEQTKAQLPDEITVPSDIPFLIEKTFDDDKLSECPEYMANIKKKTDKAKKYCIPAGKMASKRASLSALLTNGAQNSESAESSVRDADEKIEVLLLRRVNENRLELVSGEKSFDIHSPLDGEEARAIARQRICLPYIYDKPFGELVKELDIMPKTWRESGWLCGELLLCLDAQNNAAVADTKLNYSEKYGLMREKKL